MHSRVWQHAVHTTPRIRVVHQRIQSQSNRFFPLISSAINGNSAAAAGGREEENRHGNHDIEITCAVLRGGGGGMMCHDACQSRFIVPLACCRIWCDHSPTDCHALQSVVGLGGLTSPTIDSSVVVVARLASIICLFYEQFLQRFTTASCNMQLSLLYGYSRLDLLLVAVTLRSHLL